MILKKLFKKIFEEDDKEIEEIRERVLNLTEEGDYGLCSPPLDPQVALNELCRFFLGEDWYGFGPSQSQLNTEIVYEIEMKYRDCVKRKKINKKGDN